MSDRDQDYEDDSWTSPNPHRCPFCQVEHRYPAPVEPPVLSREFLNSLEEALGEAKWVAKNLMDGDTLNAAANVQILIRLLESLSQEAE